VGTFLLLCVCVCVCVLGEDSFTGRVTKGIRSQFRYVINHLKESNMSYIGQQP